MTLMVDLRNPYFDFIHGFLVKQVFYHVSYCIIVVNDLVRELDYIQYCILLSPEGNTVSK